jgi:hypothetical protein
VEAISGGPARLTDEEQRRHRSFDMTGAEMPGTFRPSSDRKRMTLQIEHQSLKKQ